MKKLLLILLCLPLIGLSQSEFKIGWDKGYINGYCGNDLSCIDPIPPIPPSILNKRPSEVSEYQFGFNEGYKKGLKVKANKGNFGTGDESSQKLLDNYTKIKQQEIQNSKESEEFYRNQTAENEKQISQNVASIGAAIANQRAANMGWEKINKTRWTYTYVGMTGFARIKKLKKKALKEVENQSVIAGWDYEIVRILEYKMSFGILPKVTVILDIDFK
jgi:hypothetical protein